MTRGKFVTKVARKVGLTTTEGHDELTFLRDLFYEAMVEVLLETHCYVDYGDMTLTIGIAEYRTDDDILAVLNRRETSQGQGYGSWPEVVSMAELLALQATTQSGSPPQKMAIEGNFLIVWPTPSAADVIRWVFVPRPTAASADTEDSTVLSGIAPEYDRALEYYGLWQASEYDEKKLAQGPMDYEKQFRAECVRVKKRHRAKAGRGLAPARVGYPGSYARVKPRNDIYP